MPPRGVVPRLRDELRLLERAMPQLPYVFNDANVPIAEGTVPVPPFLPGDPNQQLADALAGAWAAFAQTGNPACRALQTWPPLTLGLPLWRILDTPPGPELRLAPTRPVCQALAPVFRGGQ